MKKTAVGESRMLGERKGYILKVSNDLGGQFGIEWPVNIEEGIFVSMV